MQTLTENPVRSVRRDLKLTQSQLASHFDVTPQTILMLEQGLFNSIPEQISRILGVSNKEYQQWVRDSRHLNSVYFDHAATDHGWQVFRLSVHASFRGFCRRLVFQPSILREFELSRQRNRQILSEALIQVHLSDEALLQLNLFTREDLES